MYLAFPTFVLGALHYNVELGYSWTSVIGLVWTLLDSSGHNLFQNRVTAAPDNWDPSQMENNGQRNMTVAATRNTYQGSSTAVFILVFIAQMVLFVFYCVSVWENGRPCFEEPRQFVYYMVGNLVKGIYFMIANLMYGADQFSLDCEYWRNAQYAAETVGFELRVGSFKNELGWWTSSMNALHAIGVHGL